MLSTIEMIIGTIMIIGIIILDRHLVLIFTFCVAILILKLRSVLLMKLQKTTIFSTELKQPIR